MSDASPFVLHDNPIFILLADIQFRTLMQVTYATSSDLSIVGFNAATILYRVKDD